MGEGNCLGHITTSKRDKNKIIQNEERVKKAALILSNSVTADVLCSTDDYSHRVIGHWPSTIRVPKYDILSIPIFIFLESAPQQLDVMPKLVDGRARLFEQDLFGHFQMTHHGL